MSSNTDRPAPTLPPYPPVTTASIHPSLRHISLPPPSRLKRPEHNWMLFNNGLAACLSGIFIASVFCTLLRGTDDYGKTCVIYGLLTVFLLATYSNLYYEMVAMDRWIAREITEVDVLVGKLAYETRVNRRLIRGLRDVQDRDEEFWTALVAGRDVRLDSEMLLRDIETLRANSGRW